jgi:hypothetical protein
MSSFSNTLTLDWLRKHGLDACIAPRYDKLRRFGVILSEAKGNVGPALHRTVVERRVPLKSNTAVSQGKASPEVELEPPGSPRPSRLDRFPAQPPSPRPTALAGRPDPL